jgi:PAS domain S-box-containing protein
MGRRIRSYDWSATPVGPLAQWSAPLRTTVALLLSSPVPMVLLWGEKGTMIYNDAYSQFAGGRHPGLLGQEVLQGWPEAAELNAEVMRVGLAGGTLSFKDRELVLNRNGSPGVCWLNLDYSPVYDSDGVPCGVIAIVIETTDRVLADRALRDERSKLAALFTQAPSFMALLEGDEHRISLANPNYLALVGNRPVVGLTVKEALPDAAAQGYVELLDHVYRTGEPFQASGATYAVQPEKDGPQDDRLVDFVFQPIRDADGAVSGIFVQGVDVTQRAGEQKRREALYRLTDLVRSVADPVELAFGAAEIVCETLDVARCGLSRIDPQAETLITERDWTASGVTALADRLPLRAFGSFIDSLKAGEFTVVADVRTDPRTSAPAASAALEAYQTRAFVNVPMLEHGQLAAVFFVNSAEPRAWSQEDLDFIREAAERTRTATERLRTERARREAVQALATLNATLEAQVAERTAERNLLATIVEETDAFVQVADLDYRWMAINRAAAAEFERLFGARPKVGERMLDLLDDQPAEREAVRALWSRALQGEEFTAISDFGDPRFVAERQHYEMKFNTLRDEQGRQIGAFQVVTNITDRIQAEARQAQLQEALRQSQKMEAMGQLTGGVAHDFNNLLMPIIGALDMLQRRLTLPAREARLVDGALQSADRAKTLVQRLLAFARRQPLQSGAVDVPSLVKGMSDLVSSTTGPRIVVRSEVPQDIPSALGDANQLEMALLNLCVNARDAMPDGGAITVAASAERPPADVGVRRRDETHVRLSVIDTGVGMDAETVKRAVEPFFSTKGLGKGTGLGLSMVHGLASQLGGALKIDSRPGSGTRIDLWLPISKDQAGPTKSEARATLETFKGRVLVVDDEPFVRMTTADMLQGLGYETEEAEDASEAERRITAGERFDLVVSDHLMPGMSGAELARRMREQFPEIPVLIVSGYADAKGVSPDLARLSKPFRQAELAEAIKKMQARRSSVARG